MPVTPVPAATIMLLRDGCGAPEVLMIERHARSVFLPDTFVFPGGRVDESDRELAGRVAGVDAAALVRALGGGLGPTQALAFVVAAIRETFEEAGILLARPQGGAHVLDGARAEALGRHRTALQAERTTFSRLVEDEDLELAADALALHGRWITPEMMPYRFDTVFFTAVAPPDQHACADGIEAAAHVWIQPAEALTQRRAGVRRMIFPTAANLASVAGYVTAREAVGASRRRRIVPVLPRLAEVGGAPRLVIPTDAGYTTSEADLDDVFP
jgi:8-oxo-dGTP pyrophosphatase MutT (NUDIX family)